ncbi:hypothetical protein [uncultured Tenacibaculum sp.]|uniref:hypothetical protein n=1 Tax=uncultured Tenacibaculum sp. TaxID=174713 RepID=UPI00261E76A0|nr:hypothetical protein [uncultured Tenacibaculum sp.]
MIPNLPLYISISFILLTVYIVFMFIKSNKLSNTAIVISFTWIVLISILSYIGIYHFQEEDSVSRFGLIIIPTTVFIMYLLRTKTVYNNRDIRWSTALHIVRFPIELLLFQLAIREWLPMEMTYKGWNFDIIPGITAILLVVWMHYKTINRQLLIGWNIIGVCLVLFVFINGVLSQEMLYQRYGYAVPNRGIAYFPIILLAGVIVPVVVYTHISDIILLVKRKATI